MIDDLEELAALRDTGPAPWAGGERHLHLRLRWDELTGRQIGATWRRADEMADQER